MELPEGGNSVPRYIQSLLSPDAPSSDYHIIVGDPQKGEPEKIGVIKWMLLVRSPVLRCMIEDSPLRSDTGFSITDIEPDIFKHFLMFVYGHDTTSYLSVVDALDLLYLAEKYEVLDLKDRLGSVLSPHVQLGNIFTFLQYHSICETTPKLWKAITQIIQTKTREVFYECEFLESKEGAVLKIIEQNSLSVPEIEVWRAALNWAKHQVTRSGCEISPEILRTTIKPLLRHIRLATWHVDDLFREVIPTKLLSDTEIIQVCASITQKENCIRSNYLCNEIKKRALVGDLVYLGNKTLSMANSKGFNHNESNLFIVTKDVGIQLCAFGFFGEERPYTKVPTELTYQVSLIITITRIFVYANNTEPSFEFRFSRRVEYDTEWQVSPCERVALEPNSKYIINITFNRPQLCSFGVLPVAEDFEVVFNNAHTSQYHCSICKSLSYNTIP